MATIDLGRILHTRDTQELEKAVQAAIDDPTVMEQLVVGLTSPDDFYRFNCFQSLLQVSERQPKLVYPTWGRLAAMLKSENSYHRSIGICMVANLTRVDELSRFEEIVDDYFAMLDDESFITAHFLAQNAGKVARFKPALQSRITDLLLSVDATHHKQKELLKADVIAAFDEFFEESKDKGRIMEFVFRQIESSSPKTKKVAQTFLKRRAA